MKALEKIGERAQGRGVSQGLVALQAAKPVSRLGEARLTAERAHQRGVTRDFMKISAVAVNGAAPDVAENESSRVGAVSRETKETSVEVSINLDGTGMCDCDTGIPFLDHMLDQLASHGLFDVRVKAKGDTHIDDHHTNEDVGLAMGTIYRSAASIVVPCSHLSDSSEWQDVEFALGWVYVIEMGLKVLVYGFNNYWRSSQNQFDFVITVTIVIGETAAFFSPTDLPFFSNEEWIRYLLIARLLRLTRLLVLVERYKVMVATFFKLIPNLTPYLGIVFCLMCLFCSLGVHLFGGLVYAGNPILESTSMFENDYLLQNFNNFASGMVTLFDLLIMGNWQTWMDSYTTLTGKWWTIFFFWSFYVIAVLFLLNLVQNSKSG